MFFNTPMLILKKSVQENIKYNPFAHSTIFPLKKMRTFSTSEFVIKTGTSQNLKGCLHGYPIHQLQAAACLKNYNNLITTSNRGGIYFTLIISNYSVV